MPIRTTKVRILSVQPNCLAAVQIPIRTPQIVQRIRAAPDRMERCRKALQYLVQDRTVQAVGAAEVALNKITEPDDVALDKGAIEAEIAVQLLNIFRRCERAEDRGCGIAWNHRHDREHDDGQPEQNRDQGRNHALGYRCPSFGNAGTQRAASQVSAVARWRPSLCRHPSEAERRKAAA